jgi:hypothetical protein
MDFQKSTFPQLPFRIALVAMLLVGSFDSHAHSSGHGPEVSGLGPNGGKRTAIIRAKDSELGVRAPLQAIAEWKKTAEKVQITLWSAETLHSLNQAASIESPPGPIKWILLGKKLKSPVVISQVLAQPTHQIDHQFTSQELLNVETIEMILPGMGSNPEKHVLLFKL